MEKRIHRMKTSLGTCRTAKVSGIKFPSVLKKRGGLSKNKQKNQYEQNTEKDVWTILAKIAGEYREYLVQTEESKCQAEFGPYSVNEDV